MTRAELMKEVLQGIPLLGWGYRGSLAEMVGYVDKKYGTAIQYVRRYTSLGARRDARALLF